MVHDRSFQKFTFVIISVFNQIPSAYFQFGPNFNKNRTKNGENGQFSKIDPRFLDLSFWQTKFPNLFHFR